MVFTYGVGSQQAREAGARFIVTRETLRGAAPVFQDGGGYVYEDKGALPRVRDEAGKKMKAFTLSPTRINIQNDDVLPQQAIIADQWYPGWHARYYDTAVALTRGPDVFRTMTLTPQQQRLNAMNNPLEMRYEPEAFQVGLYALCLALGGAAAITTAALTRLNRRCRRA